MNKPRFFTRILGHPLITGGGVTLSIGILHYWYVHQYDKHREAFLWLAPVFGLWFLYKTIAAALHVRNYKKWSASYKSLHPGSEAAKWRMHWRALFIGLGCGGLVYVARPYLYYDDWVVILALCGAVVFVRLVWMCFAVWKGNKTTAQSSEPSPLKASEKTLASPVAASDKNYVVSVALSVPRTSPAANKAVHALPDYCKTLMKEVAPFT